MKKLFLLYTFTYLACIGTSAKAPLDSFYVIGKDLLAKTIIAWSKDNGRLVRFTANDVDIRNLQKGDVIDVNPGLKKVTQLGKASRNYALIQPDKSEPLGIVSILQVNGVSPIIRTKINKSGVVGAGPMSDSLMGAISLVNTIVNITVDYAEGVSLVSAQNISGNTFQFSVPALIAKTLNIGGPVFGDSINSFAIVQPIAGNEMYSYGYPIESSGGTAAETKSDEKWAITSVPGMRGRAGRLNLQFPNGVSRRVEFYTTDGKYIKSYTESEQHKYHNIAPGVYNIGFTYVMVSNVPIESGKETRIKSGFLDIVSNEWSLYDESKQKFYTSDNEPRKLALPVGRYQLKLKKEFHPTVIVIKDGETVMIRK